MKDASIYSEQRLYSVVLRLGALRKGAVPADHGKQALAALYNLLRLGDEGFAEELHNSNQHKPFTVSLLDGRKTDRKGTHHYGEGDSAEWRFTLLRDPAFEAVVQRYVNNNNLPHIRIGAVDFQIVDAYVSGSHPRSGYVSLEQLRDRYLTKPAQKRVLLNFAAPTAFALGSDRTTNQRRWRVLPDPRTLFSSLRKRWVQLGGGDPGDEFDNWVDKTIEAYPIALRWQRLTVEGSSLRAFTGSVRFDHWGDDERWLPVVNLLADLTFFTGVGYQTTRGMGQVWRIDEDAPNE